jgi:hypothetical protein
MNDEDEPAAQGTALISEGKLADGKYSVSMQLYKPPENYAGKDPDDQSGGEFNGEARYFSLVLSPQTALNDGAIWVKGSMFALNNSLTVIDWENTPLSDFRAIKKTTLWNDPGLNFPRKQERLYDAVVCKDDAITTTAP